MEKIYPKPDAAMNELFTTCGLDEQVKQMALAKEHHVEQRLIPDMFDPPPPN